MYNNRQFQSTSFIRRMTQLPYPRLSSWQFQSTSFIRRMTAVVGSVNGVIMNFNPHPSYEVWQARSFVLRTQPRFQSTSFIRRMTGEASKRRYPGSKFQSTSFIRRMTPRGLDPAVGRGNFNPHPSYEGWPLIIWFSARECDFNPHPSYEGWLNYFD